MTTRRDLIAGAGLVTVSAVLGRRYWPAGVSDARLVDASPYGEMQAPDANGISLPAGFGSRVLARTGQAVATTGYVWHVAPDGGACFAAPDGGWVYVSNSEVGGARGGASALRFDRSGSITAAYSVLSGTSINCAGGATPRGTWLSCEEHATGLVYECDPQRPGNGVARPALGAFKHEAAAEDPATGFVYLTEDDPLGRLYRFAPATAGDLSRGVLFAAAVGQTNGAGSPVTWIPASATMPARGADTTPFNGGEGIHIDGRTAYFATKGDRRVWRLGLDSDQLALLWELPTPANGGSVDNVFVHQPSGDVYVAQDGGDVQVHLVVPTSLGPVAHPFLRFEGHTGSEATGPAFSPDGTRMYVSSQRGTDGRTGWTVEVSGPFRRTREPGTASSSGQVYPDRLGIVE